jgi:hypothetical protein
MPSNPTVQQMKYWNKDELLEWMEQEKPQLLGGENLNKFKAAGFLGENLLRHAGNADFFMKAGLPLGVCDALASLGVEIKEGGEFIPWT